MSLKKLNISKQSKEMALKWIKAWFMRCTRGTAHPQPYTSLFYSSKHCNVLPVEMETYLRCYSTSLTLILFGQSQQNVLSGPTKSTWQQNSTGFLRWLSIGFSTAKLDSRLEGDTKRPAYHNSPSSHRKPEDSTRMTN